MTGFVPQRLCKICYVKKPVTEFYINKKPRLVVGGINSGDSGFRGPRKSSAKYSSYCKKCELLRQARQRI